MSSSAAPARTRPAQKGEFRSLDEWLQAIGAKRGYDTLPTGHREAWKSRKNPNKMRALGWLMDYTMGRAPNGARWTVAHDMKRGYLTTKEAAHDLGWSQSNTITMFQELEEEHYLRIDKERHILFLAEPDPPELQEGEEMANNKENDESVLCTYNAPTHLRLWFEQLDSKRRSQCERLYLEGERAKKALVKEAMAAARAKAPEIDEAVYAQMGYTPPEENRGRPKLERVLNVELTVKKPFYVQKTEEVISTENKEDLYKAESDSLQKTRPYVAKNRSLRVSECEPEEAPTEASSAATHPPEPEPEPANRPEDQREIAEALEHAGFPVPRTDPLLSQFAALATEFEIPARSVCRAIVAKVEQKREQGKPIYNAGALYEFVKTDLPTWIRQHPRELEYDRKLAAKTGGSPDAGKPATVNKAQAIETLEKLISVYPPESPLRREWELELRYWKNEETLAERRELLEQLLITFPEDHYSRRAWETELQTLKNEPSAR